MPAATDEMFKLRLFRRDGETVEQFVAAADRGQLKLGFGRHDSRSEPEPTITLTLSEVDALINALPQLRAWMATGRPACGPYEG
jgi:hypothetical protein